MFKSCLWRRANEKGIYGEQDENGIVTFVVDAGPDSPVRGTEMFNRMLDFFGDDVRAICGTWRKSNLGLPSANIDKVNELTALGTPLEEALLQTWTVTRAAKRGYGKVRLLETPDGAPGAYTRIVVLMERSVAKTSGGE
jgi:hypothetical protein